MGKAGEKRWRSGAALLICGIVNNSPGQCEPVDWVGAERGEPRRDLNASPPIILEHHPFLCSERGRK